MKILTILAAKVSILYVLAALLPALVLLHYVYRQDRVEREPPGLLLSLLWQGVKAALAAIVLEIIAESLLDRFFVPGSFLHTVLLAFFVVAAVEEGTKYYFLKRRTWRDPNFNYRFDAIVYAVFVSLGFAAFENIQYVFAYGLSVAIPRALLSIPGHMVFSVHMGIHYGRARLRENYGHPVAASAERKLAYLSAVILHGIYDTCAMLGTRKAMAVFFVFVIIVYSATFRRLRKESDWDMLV